MKNSLKYLFLLLSIGFFACKKDNTNAINPPSPVAPANRVTSAEFIDKLLFVNKNDFKISTNKPAQFSSISPLIKISADGMISRITSGEVVPIEITWTEQPESKTTIYALGATDTNHDAPYASYHGVVASDPYNSYVQGWKTLNTLSVATETFALIMRHGDADNGRDFSAANPGVTGPSEWWKSCDPRLARQLNERGKTRSVEMGKILKDLKYPISRVISSEFCRSVATAQLINAGPEIKTDGRINHVAYNLYKKGSLNGMVEVLTEQPIDNKMTLMVLHHPTNETGSAGFPSFPGTSPFTWGGFIIVKVSPEKVVSYQGAVSHGMMEYHRNLKLNK